MLMRSIDAGKPHNFVCSKCRLPEYLIGCGTCCRAYHVQCLSADAVPGFFHCSSCKEKAWDQEPPSLSAMSDSQDETPGSSFQRTEPPSRQDGSNQETPLAEYDTPGFDAPNLPSGRDDKFDTDDLHNLPPIFEMYSQILAHLYQPDANPTSSVHQPEFLNQLNLMVREVESHRSLLEKMATFREDFSRLQTENLHLREYLNSRLPIAGTVARSSNFSEFPRPSADTIGKTWDRIAMDLI